MLRVCSNGVHRVVPVLLPSLGAAWNVGTHRSILEFGHQCWKRILLPYIPNRTPDTVHQILDTGHRIPDTRYQIPDTRYRIPDTGYRTPDTGYRTPDTGHQIPDPRYRIDTGYPTPDTGYRTPDTGYQTPDTGYLTLQIGIQNVNLANLESPYVCIYIYIACRLWWCTLIVYDP